MLDGAGSRADTDELRPVLNATGVVVHTNLGRAPLSAGGGRGAGRGAAGYVDVELDLATGTRSKRGRGRAGGAARGLSRRPRTR